MKKSNGCRLSASSPTISRIGKFDVMISAAAMDDIAMAFNGMMEAGIEFRIRHLRDESLLPDPGNVPPCGAILEMSKDDAHRMLMDEGISDTLIDIDMIKRGASSLQTPGNTGDMFINLAHA